MARASAGLRRERIVASPRFDGARFHNTRRVGPGLKSGSGPALLRDLVGSGRR